ncbi:MAG: TRAP transporter small permease [Ramlibacter sp.]|nr:TRAP transporter small permease [Ramlibacter sp.]MBX3658060.1 TRAP transporter small permease [Ramlibacter sp.]MCW5648648.1 TRAP transporter small permease [Ramlibacter sp.]
MQRFREGYGLFLEWVVMVLMGVLFLEVTLGIVFRTLGRSLVWYDEIASVLLAWLTFYGSALASVKRAHIGCPELVEQFPPAARRAVGLLGQVAVIGFFALLGWVGLSIMPILAGDSLVSLPWVPMNVVQSVIPISSALILVAEVMYFIDLVSPRPSGDASAALPDGLH